MRHLCALLACAAVCKSHPLVIQFCASTPPFNLTLLPSGAIIDGEGNCLGGAAAAGDPVLAVPCAPGDPTQAWAWVGSSTVQSLAAPDLCWEVRGLSTAPGTPVVLASCQAAPLYPGESFTRQADGRVLTQEVLCAAASPPLQPPEPSLTLALRSCNASVPAARFNASKGTLVDGNGMCLGGAFLSGDAVRAQPCVEGAPSQAYALRADRKVEAAQSGLCLQIIGSLTLFNGRGARAVLGSCSSGNSFALRGDGTLVWAFLEPIPGQQAPLCLSTANVPLPFFTAVRWTRLPAPPFSSPGSQSSRLYAMMNEGLLAWHAHCLERAHDPGLDALSRVTAAPWPEPSRGAASELSGGNLLHQLPHCRSLQPPGVCGAAGRLVAGPQCLLPYWSALLGKGAPPRVPP